MSSTTAPANPALTPADIASLKANLPSIEDLLSSFNDYLFQHSDVSYISTTLTTIFSYLANPSDYADHTDVSLPDIEPSFLDSLTLKVRELITMLDYANETINPPTPPEPVSIGNINNVALTIFRRIFYVCNQDVIDRYIPLTNYKYPYIEVDPDLLPLYRNLFLHIYFSQFRTILIPLMVYSMIPFCCAKSSITLKHKYPFDRKANVYGNNDLNAYHIYGGVMKHNTQSPTYHKRTQH